ncbi:MAG TPA: hypothetical protein ENI23_06460 [bacterium]|nr:hypothetical protein [bacterium]
MKKLILTLGILFIPFLGFSQVSVDPFITTDDVTIDHLEAQRLAFQTGINSADGGLLQAGTVIAGALDDNANPEKRWDEAFNDFVFTGLLPPTSATLTTTTTSGTAYIEGTRVAKGATANTYTASKHTFVDISKTGTFTYAEVAIGGAEPSVTPNSIRLARVSSDSSTILEVEDKRTTTLTTIAASTKIIDQDGDTSIDTEENSDEDILRTKAASALVMQVSADGMSLIGGVDVNHISPDGGFDANSDNNLVTEKAIKTFVDNSTSVKVATFTYDLSTATGTQAITGTGFTPRLIEFHLVNTAGNLDTVSFGFSDASTDIVIFATDAGDFDRNTAKCILYNNAAAEQQATLNSFDADGFTLGWTKVNSPTGTAQINYKATR